MEELCELCRTLFSFVVLEISRGNNCHRGPPAGTRVHFHWPDGITEYRRVKSGCMNYLLCV